MLQDLKTGPPAPYSSPLLKAVMSIGKTLRNENRFYMHRLRYFLIVFIFLFIDMSRISALAARTSRFMDRASTLCKALITNHDKQVSGLTGRGVAGFTSYREDSCTMMDWVVRSHIDC